LALVARQFRVVLVHDRQGRRVGQVSGTFREA